LAVTSPSVFGEPARVGFEELYAAHQPRVYRTCLAILRNADDAADATHEVFSRALPLLTELREPHVWLQTVARNHCLDQLRRQKVRGPGTQLDEETAGSQRHDPERETMLRDALRQAFSALSPRERRALARVLVMDDSLADIAQMLGISYGAAAQVVSRARRRAALAARAVIGASLAWLARLTLPRDRGRATRAAAQVLQSSQNLVIAAVVVFTAGGLARSEPGVTPAASGGASVVPIAPTAASHRVESALPKAPGPAAAAAAPAKLPVSGLPAGYGPLLANGEQNPIGADGPGSKNSGPGSGGPDFVKVTVSPLNPDLAAHCTTVGFNAGPGGNPQMLSPQASVCH
jgi:RNA polymerase sigma-70 factor, ECF subfamily